MKQLLAIFFSVAILLSNPFVAGAQAKPRTEIASVKQNGDKVEFTLTSSRPFIFANNRYILYIGEKEFYLNKQWAEKGKGTMIFYIPAVDFYDLKEGAAIYLTYGNVFRDALESEREEISKENGRCWPLGKFSQSLLTK